MRTLVVGDVHGCADELRQLVAIARADRVVLVGDLFRKGPDPGGVWRLIREGGFEAVLGNHDERLLLHLDGKQRDKESKRCIKRLDEAGGDWKKWLRDLPLFLKARPFTVVHAGLHPTGKIKRTTRDMALHMRRWNGTRPVGSGGRSGEHPYWYDVYTGKRRVIFGHDAVRGLVRIEHGGEPWLIGLDTGCVYGGTLSGYLVEEDHLVQVAALDAYRPIGRPDGQSDRPAVDSSSSGGKR